MTSFINCFMPMTRSDINWHTRRAGEENSTGSGVRQVSGGRRAPAGAGTVCPVPAAQDPGILPVGRGKTAVRGVEGKTPVREMPDGKKSVALWQRFCFWKTDGECCFVVRKTLYLNGAAHSNDQFLGYGKAKAVSGSCSGRIALI